MQSSKTILMRISFNRELITDTVIITFTSFHLYPFKNFIRWRINLN